MESSFAYLDPKDIYLDSACQTLRPQEVIDAQAEYFREFNACGGRVKYGWGERLDGVILDAREAVLKMLKRSGKEYAVAFTLNTTYGINLVLGSLPQGKFSKIVTSDIEHNSVFLPTMTAARRLGIPREVLPRLADGSLDYSGYDLAKSAVLVNAMSNIDGRGLVNAAQLAKDARAKGGILLLDAAQAFGHDPDLLREADFDALFASSHKAYGPSLGIIVIKRELLRSLDVTFVGGGTVSDVEKEAFTLIGEEEPHARLEPGLQNFSGIVGFETALKWFAKNRDTIRRKEEELGASLFEGLKELPVTVLNIAPAPLMSFYSEKLDAHRLAIFLSENDIMARSGYFCCHYYLDKLKHLPPLLRFSIGAYNTKEDIEKTLAALKTILKT